MVMFVISGIATYTEYLFADSRASNTCSFCGHNNSRHSRVSSGKSTDDKCNFCGHSNKRKSHFSRQNNKNGCQFCKHGLENGEYSRQAEEYRSPSSDHNYGDEETENEGRNSRSNTITKNETVKGKYALDLRGVHFYNEKAESSVSENENEYEEDEFSSDIMSEGDDSADFDGQRHHVRSLDDWEEYDDSSYGDESDNYDTNDESDESDDYDESDEEEEQEEKDQSEEDDFDNENEKTEDEMTDIEADQIPMEQQLPPTSLPTVPTGETTDSLQYPALPQTPQYPVLDQQNQLGTMDPSSLANQYPYGQQNIENMNVNMQPNQLLQAGQYGINDMNNGAYWQMGNASMMPQYGNGGMSQQAYASVVNETIEYLRNLGVLDENRVSKMSAGMVDGECIICMRPKFVFQIRGQGMRGVCEDCLRSRDSYGGAFGAGGIKGVLERGVMSLFGGGNDDNRGGGGNNGIRSYGSGGGYDDSGGGYYGNQYSNGEMVGNGTPSPVGADQLRTIANRLTGGGLGGIFGAGNNIFGNGTNGFTGSGGQQMVMNAAGQLVPMGSDPSAPYGYVKDPTTGQMRPATSAAEGLAAGAAAAAAGATTAPGVTNAATAGVGAGAGGQQMVMNASGQLVPMGSDPSAPYGYVKDPTTGQMRPATSAAEGLAAGAAAAAARATTAPGVTNAATAGVGAGAGGQQMVMNASGQLVPIGSDPSAPYGYVKDPSTGQMRPATSASEGLAAGAAAAAAGATTAPGVTNAATAGGGAGAGRQQMVLNAQGQLVPMGSDPSAPYGYVKDPTSGQMRPATSPEEGLAAGAAAAAAGATTAPGVTNGTTAGVGAGAGGQQMVMNAQGQLVPMGSDPSAPYGYVKDPSTGQMRPATSPEEGLAAGAAAAAAGATTAPGVTNAATEAVAKATGTATSAVSTAANAATGAVENVTNTAVGAANTAVNAANKAVTTAANTATQISNSAEAIKNAAQPLASLASSFGSIASWLASGVKSKASGLRPATTLEEGLEAGAAAANAGATTAPDDTNSVTKATVSDGVARVGSQQMVMNDKGQLIAVGSDLKAPYGYVLAGSGGYSSNQLRSKKNQTSSSNTQTTKKKKKKSKGSDASAGGNTDSSSGTQQQSSKKKKKQKNSTTSANGTSGTQNKSTKKKKKS